MVWRGYYSNTNAYNIGDVVYMNNEAWVALMGYPNGGAPQPGTPGTRHVWAISSVNFNLPQPDIMRTLVKLATQPVILTSNGGPLTIDFSMGNRFLINLSANVTVANVVNALDGEEVTITVKVLTTGATLTWESRFQNGASVGINSATGNNTAGQYVTEKWAFDGVANLFYPTAPQLW